MWLFSGGSSKQARVPITVTPSGIPCTVEVYLAVVGTSNKVTTSGPIAFTSTGVQQQITCPITIPSVSGEYEPFIVVMSGTTLLKLASDINNTIGVPGVDIGDIDWS